MLKKPVKDWVVKDVINWLKLVDFGMYTSIFEDQKVTLLCQLSWDCESEGHLA